APKVHTPPVLIYNTGENHWDTFHSWPLSCDKGCENTSKPLYLTAGFGLSFTLPTGDVKSPSAFDEYVSDPAKPVPYLPRRVLGCAWVSWRGQAERSVEGRPAVLPYVTPPLTDPLRISGGPAVNLVASTSGTDSDWVVKLIDVFPDEVPSQQELGGYELSI